MNASNDNVTENGGRAVVDAASAPSGAGSVVEAEVEAEGASEAEVQPQVERGARVGPIVTPADSVPVPVAGPDDTHDLSRPEYFLNRELTWLNFNYRVLHEAEDERTPLLERLKFVAIVSSNLDEFFMKRIGGLKQQVGAGLHELTVDGRRPHDQIVEAHTLVRELETRKHAALEVILSALRAEGVRVVDYEELDVEARKEARDFYVENIYPLVTPQASDPAHPFPFISNLSTNLLVSLRHPRDADPLLARVKVPMGSGISRFIELEGGRTFVALESVMAGNLDLLFPGMEIDACELFRVTRNANTETEEEKAEDLLAMIETELRERRFAPIVRLEVEPAMSTFHRGMLAAELGLHEDSDVFDAVGMLGPRALMEIVNRVSDPELHDPPHHPADHAKLPAEREIFHAIREAGSVLVHHPYESFSTSVERFLKEASQDPKVRAIKMTFYRTSEESNAIRYLMDAARNGKEVTVVMELKARFDEQANIRWASHLGAAGIHVTYGVVGLKTHTKVILVVRQDYDGLRRYAHIGTGNYHAGTARIYSDLGILTCDDEIGGDLTELFNYLTTGFKPKRKYRKLLPAPKVMKPALLARIARESKLHSEDSPGLIQFKMNALEDPDVTRALYRAAQAGVQVDLIVRDSCRLRPGIPGLSENVRVVSIVGRFLEHSRIYYFRNGWEEEYFIGSADCMKRNLDSRVEILVPVEPQDLQAELRFMLDADLSDQRCAWDMRSDGSYLQRRPRNRKQEQCVHAILADRAHGRFRQATRLRRRKPREIRHSGRDESGWKGPV